MSAQTLAPEKQVKLREHTGLYTMLIFMGIVIFHLIYFNKAFPASEAWHITYVNLMEDGKIPYRDFYYYLPPLDLFVSRLFWKLSFGSYLAYRGWRLMERVLIAEVMFRLLRRKTSPEIAMIASVIGAILSAASVYDLVGDYNQTIFLLVALLLGAILHFLHTEGKKRRLAAFGTGFCVGMLFLGKQPHFVAFLLVMLAALLWYGWRTRDRKTWLYVLLAAFGTLVPIGICAAWLQMNGALMPFVEQVFLNTDSKGSLFDLIFKSLYLMIADEKLIPLLLIIAVFCLVYLYVKNSRREIFRSVWFQRSFQILSVLAAVWILYRLRYIYHTAIHTQIEERHYFEQFIILCLTLVPGVTIVLLENKRDGAEIEDRRFSLWPVLVFSAVLLLDTLMASFNFRQIASSLYESQDAFTNLTIICQRIITMLIVTGLFVVGVQSLRDEAFDRWDTFFMLAVAFAGNYAAKMGSGESLCSPHYYNVSVPVLLAIACPRGVRRRPLAQTGAMTACFLMILVLGCQKSVSSYRWWGWAEAPVSAHTETLDIKGMEGFRVTPETKELYEEITRVVRENTDEDSHVLGYPHNVIFNQLAGRNRMDRFVPVYFYDVCARKYVEEDFERIKENPPGLIVYQNIPYCYDVHMSTFQDGEELAHHDLEEWLAVNRNLSYELVGQYENFYVYKLKDNGLPVGYTYLEEENINTTGSVLERFSDGELVKKNEEIYEAKFKGDGTIGDPYLIRSTGDLLHLAEAVKNGVMFKGKFFRQTRDISLASVESWEPIGAYDSGAYFCGTYNGDGHTITDLRCIKDPAEGHCGLFGDLAGTVVNLGMRDCAFTGRIAGTIASNCYGAATIINCYAVNCEIKASKAAGGIAGYFYGGYITNCFTDCSVEILEEEGEALREAYPFAHIVCEPAGYGITTGAAEARNCFSVGYEPYAGNATFLTSSSNFEISSANLNIVQSRLNEFIRDTKNPNYVSWVNENGEVVFRQG